MDGCSCYRPRGGWLGGLGGVLAGRGEECELATVLKLLRLVKVVDSDLTLVGIVAVPVVGVDG